MFELLASPTFRIIFKALSPKGIAAEQKYRNLNVTSFKTHLWLNRLGVDRWLPDKSVKWAIKPFLYDLGYSNEVITDFQTLYNILNAALTIYVQNI